MNSVASTLNRVTGMEINNQISVLTQNNWNTWKHDMQVLLMHYGCWQFIIQTKPEQPDEEATYKEKLDLQLREDVGIFISRVKTAATRLQEAGHKLDDLYIGFQLIRWLPQEFQSTVQQIYRWKEEDFRVVKIEAELILEANRLQLMKQDLEKAENAYLSSFTSKKSKTLPGAAAHGDPNGKNDYQKKSGKLGDEKPSHLLRKMKELSNGQLQDDFLQSLWLQRMPPHIQTVLSASSEPLDKLAIIADKVSEVVGSSSTICAATTFPPPSQSSSCSVQPTMDSLARQIQELSLQVAELTRERNSSRHQRYSSDRRRSHSRSRSVNRGSGICYYHRRYKEQARKCISPCAFVQKKRVSSVIAGMAEPSKHTSRLFLLDRKSGQKFLIDSGSEICVIPPSPTMNKSPQSNFSLFAANNTKIPAYGMVRKELNLGLRRPFIWTFIIADVSSPIIGADFLKHFNLLIDLKKKRLVDVETSLFTSCVFSNIVQPSILTVDANISFKNILSEYPDLSNPSLISKSASHGTVHHIITTGPPVTARPRRLHPKLYDAVKVEFEFLLAQGIIRPSKSPWSSPLHVVPKSDSTVRPVGDYRQLNSVTEFDSYPMPYLNDFAHALHGKKIFSKIDIFKAFHQIPIAECDIPKTAVTIPWGLYEYTHLCFGLVNAPQTFMRFMHEVLRGLPFVLSTWMIFCVTQKMLRSIVLT
ncbi:retrovirus-related Pol polyprotein from transposon opus [Trichonephila clavipes]|nr:retrovirus-related Pol polyprotein from transposon opus [Trichonephila clavipes]